MSRFIINLLSSIVHRRWSTAGALCLLLTLTTTTNAQSLADYERSPYSPAAYYNYAEPGDVTILVSVWGAVANKGLYEVVQGTTLSTLLSVAGGPAIAQRMSWQDWSLTLKLFRNEMGHTNTIFELVMENEIEIIRGDPILLEGDVLTVEILTRQRFTWRDVLSVISTGASVAVALHYFTR